jgi:hypothetical protein
VPYPLEGVWGKFGRADEHLHAFDEEANAFLQGGAYQARGQLNDEATEYVVRTRINKQAPLQWALIVGDAIQNLRAALDHLLCQLVWFNGREPTRGNEFPMFVREPITANDRRAWERDLKGVHPEHRTRIEWMQPYHADEPENRPLALLAELSNADKHRIVLPNALAVHEAIAQELRPVPHDLEVIGDMRITVHAPLEDGTEIMRIPVRVTGPDPHMDMQGSIPADIAFGDSLVTRDGLVAIRNHVFRIVQVFVLLLDRDWWAYRPWGVVETLLGP